MRPRNPKLPVPADCRALARRGEICESERCAQPVCYGECCFPPISMATVHFSGCHRHTQDAEFGHPWAEEWCAALRKREFRDWKPAVLRPDKPYRPTANRGDLRIVS